MIRGMRALAAGVMLLLSQPVWAQADLKQADKHYHNFEYALALKAYKVVLEHQEPTLSVVQRIADCYRFMNNSKEAEFWYGQVLAFPNAGSVNLYYYAESAKRNGNYQKAKQLFLEYGQQEQDKSELASKLAAACDTAMAWVATPMPYDVKYLSNLNSSGADFSPTRFKEGVVFTSDRLAGNKNTATYGWTGNGYLQLYYAAKQNDSTWANPEALSASINTQYHNGPAAVLESQNLIMFTRTYNVKKREKASVDPTSWLHNPAGGKFINRLKLYTAELKKDKWVKVKPFAFNSDDYSVGHPAITADGATLYFVSDMPGGYGETDIYYSEKNADGSWGKPVNAGPAVNTPGKETFPAIGPDGTLYFSSDGHIGLGGLDVFKAVGAHKSWTGIQNLKYPINSSRDDFGILFDETGEAGYLSSGRSNSQESSFDDIYSFGKMALIPGKLQGRTVEYTSVAGSYKTQEVPVAGVKLELYRVDTKETQTIYSDKDGVFSFVVDGGVDYILRGSKKDYLNKTMQVAPNYRFKMDSVKVEMAFNRDTPNRPIIVDNIYYNIDQYDISPEAAVELDKIVKMMEDNPNISIELSSHTDSRQTHGYNLLLSELRAKAAVEYIISRGVASNRVVAKGYGETRLLNKCADGVVCSEADHRINRRTEFKIIRK